MCGELRRWSRCAIQCDGDVARSERGLTNSAVVATAVAVTLVVASVGYFIGSHHGSGRPAVASIVQTNSSSRSSVPMTNPIGPKKKQVPTTLRATTTTSAVTVPSTSPPTRVIYVPSPTQPPAPSPPPETPTTLPTHSIVGTVLGLSVPGEPCSFPSLVPPAQVIIKNEGGAVVGVADVRVPGTEVSGNGTQTCSYSWSATVPDEAFLIFQLDQSQPDTWSKARLVAGGWHVTLVDLTIP